MESGQVGSSDSRRISYPSIRDIRSGVKALSEGERDVRIREVGNDELTDMHVDLP